MTRLRVFIIEPEESMRESLALFVRNLGHEVIAVTSPNIFSCLSIGHCTNNKTDICGDALIVSQHLPRQSGLDFLSQRLASNCRGVAERMALICLPWSTGVQRKVEELGCRWFETPLDLGELRAWLDDIARDLRPDRRLLPLDELLNDPSESQIA